MPELSNFEDFVKEKVGDEVVVETQAEQTPPPAAEVPATPPPVTPEPVIPPKTDPKSTHPPEGSPRWNEIYWKAKEFDRMKAKGELSPIEKQQNELKEEIKALKESKYNDSISDLKNKAKKYLEVGDLLAYNEINEKIMENRLEKMEKELKGRVASQETTQIEPQDYQYTPQSPLNPDADMFVRRNSTWFNVSKELTDIAVTTEKMLMKDAYYANNTKALYEEIERRVAPHLKPAYTPPTGGAVEGVNYRAGNTAAAGQPLTTAEMQFATQHIGSHLSPQEAVAKAKEFRTAPRTYSLYDNTRRKK